MNQAFETAPMAFRVAAFQIDDIALVTVQDGQELVCSGAFAIRTLEDGRKAIDMGDAGVFMVTVLERDDDPAKVGSHPNQSRVYWMGSGYLA